MMMEEVGMSAGTWVVLVLALLVLYVIAKTAVVVPQQSAYVVERLGKYSDTLNAGFHILLPFLDSIRYRHSLKETAVDIPEQVCITRDNVQVSVDGVLYLKVLNPERASYGISDYHFALSQLAQTTLRTEIGKIDLDRTFEQSSSKSTRRKAPRRPSWRLRRPPPKDCARSPIPFNFPGVRKRSSFVSRNNTSPSSANWPRRTTR